MTTFRVLADNIDTMRSKLDRLLARAAKLGCDGIFSYSIGELEFEKFDDPNGVARFRRIRPVTVVGNAPRLNGWTVVAAIEHASEFGNVVKKITDADVNLTSFRDADNSCDHCALMRRRQQTYVLQNAAGEMKRVGSSCIADFTGHHSPESIVSAAQFVRDALDLVAQLEDAGGSGCNWYSLEQFLPFAVSCVRRGGFVSRAKAELTYSITTGEEAFNLMLDVSRGKVDRSVVTAEDSKQAEVIMEWAMELAQRVAVNRDGASDYEWNLSIIVRCNAIEWHHAGLAASLVPAYNRHLQEKLEKELRERSANQYFGTVGKREEFDLTLVGVTSVDSHYGVTNIHRFRDQAGNLAVWFATRERLEPGRYRVKATVKAHNVHKFTARDGAAVEERQTVLSRCKAEVQA